MFTSFIRGLIMIVQLSNEIEDEGYCLGKGSGFVLR